MTPGRYHIGSCTKPAAEPIDGMSRSLRFDVKSCVCDAVPPPDVDDRRHVVRGKLRLDEAPQEMARAQRQVRRHFVERDHVQTALGAVVREDVGLDRRRREQRPFKAFDGDVDEAEGGDGLRPAAFDDLEVVDRQIGDRIALGIGHERVELDGVNLRAEGRLGGRSCCPISACVNRATTNIVPARRANIRNLTSLSEILRPIQANDVRSTPDSIARRGTSGRSTRWSTTLQPG